MARERWREEARKRARERENDSERSREREMERGRDRVCVRVSGDREKTRERDGLKCCNTLQHGTKRLELIQSIFVHTCVFMCVQKLFVYE